MDNGHFKKSHAHIFIFYHDPVELVRQIITAILI